MGKPLFVNIPHSLGKKEARRRIEEGIGRMRTQLTGGMAGMIATKERWEGDRLTLEASGLGQMMTGRIDVLADSVHLEIDLPEFMAAIAETIKSRLAAETKRLLENK